MTDSNCRRFENMLDDFIAGALSPGEELTVRAHMEICDTCRQTYQLLQGATSALGAFTPGPLSPLVERRLIVGAQGTKEPAAHRSYRRQLVFGLAAASALVVVLVLAGVLSPLADAEKEAVALKNISTGVTLPEAPRVRSTSDGRRTASLDRHTDLWLTKDTNFKIHSSFDGGVLIELTRGRLLVNIKTHPDNYRLVVQTPTGQVEAKGTIFTVTVAPSGEERTAVLRGTVEVRSRQDRGVPERTMLVHMGEIGFTGEAAPRPLPEEAIDRELALMLGDGEKVSRSKGAATPTEPPVPEQVEYVAFESERDAPVSRKSPETDSAGSRRPSEAQLMEKALAQRKEGDHQGAARTYQLLIESHPGSSSALGARVSLGRLQLVDLKDPAAAKKSFSEYLRGSPDGMLAQEARLGIVRAALAEGDLESIVFSATEYITRYPDGYAVYDALLWRADAFRKRGECSRAITDYLQIRNRGSAYPEYSRAVNGINLCQGQ